MSIDVTKDPFSRRQMKTLRRLRKHPRVSSRCTPNRKASTEVLKRTRDAKLRTKRSYGTNTVDMLIGQLPAPEYMIMSGRTLVCNVGRRHDLPSHITHATTNEKRSVHRTNWLQGPRVRKVTLQPLRDQNHAPENVPDNTPSNTAHIVLAEEAAPKITPGDQYTSPTKVNENQETHSESPSSKAGGSVDTISRIGIPRAPLRDRREIRKRKIVVVMPSTRANPTGELIDGKLKESPLACCTKETPIKDVHVGKTCHEEVNVEKQSLKEATPLKEVRLERIPLKDAHLEETPLKEAHLVNTPLKESRLEKIGGL